MPAVTRLPVIRVQAVRERGAIYPANLDGPARLAAAARALIGDEDRECFVVLHLTHKNAIVSAEIIGRGTLCATLVHPREVFKGAILANAGAIALAHNHPSGDPTPSPEDRELTRNLIEAGNILGIQVVDHVVIAESRHCSLREACADITGWR